MRMFDSKESEDLTTEPFNYEDQLYANRQNKIGLLSNFSAETLLPKREAKTFHKFSNQSITLYNRHKKIIKLLRRMEINKGIEEQVEWMIRTAIETGKITARKLKTAVATAVYITHRLNSNYVLLSQIVKAYNVKYGDISKCLLAFKSIGLYKKLEILPVWPLYKQLVDHLFSYNCNNTIVNSSFSLDPTKLIFSPKDITEPSKESSMGSADSVDINMREKLLEIGKAIIELPEVESIRQGKMPQSFAAGIFVIGTKSCNLKISHKKIASRFNISISTIIQCKKEILKVLLSKTDNEGNKWEKVAEYLRIKN